MGEWALKPRGLGCLTSDSTGLEAAGSNPWIKDMGIFTVSQVNLLQIRIRGSRLGMFYTIPSQPICRSATAFVL